MWAWLAAVRECRLRTTYWTGSLGRCTHAAIAAVSASSFTVKALSYSPPSSGDSNCASSTVGHNSHANIHSTAGPAVRSYLSKFLAK
jgi:hypothetical protein